MIKILFLAANPMGTDALRLGEEMREIKERLRLADLREEFVVEQEWAVRVRDLQGHLLHHRPHIVHFSGHGSRAGAIILEDHAGHSALVTPDALKRLFGTLKDNIRCVVLNNCYSEAQANAIVASIDCVIGMSWAIPDKSAIAFAASFYQALGYGQSIKTAFDLGCGQIELERSLNVDSTRDLGGNENSSQEAGNPKMKVAPGVDAAKIFLSGSANDTISTSRARHKPFNLPLASLGSLFKGREAFLDDLHTRLAAPSGPAATVTCLVVHGLGGVGKTRLAVEYALRYAENHTALLFVSAPSAEALRANLANLVGELQIKPETSAIDQQLPQVFDWLNDNPGWLLIVDNVDTEEADQEIQRLLARLRAGHVLITSRIGNWRAGIAVLELDVLASAAAEEFLLERTPHRRKAADDTIKAALVAHELDGLALALEQAGAYIDKLRLSVAEYLQRLETKRLEVLRWNDPRLTQYPASIAATWETTFDQLKETERRLLEVLAWLAPEPVPLFLLDAEPLVQAVADPREALAGLAAYSLVRFDASGDAVVVHRLVQEITRGRIPAADRCATLQIALAAVNSVAPFDADDVRTWVAWTPLAAHADIVSRSADAEGLREPTATLMSQLGLYQQARGQFGAAEPLYRRALEIGEVWFSPDHPNVASVLNNLASLLGETNRLAEAEPLYRRALAIDEASFGPDHPMVGRDLNNLASLLRAANRLEEAEPLFGRALAIDERLSGPNHPDVARDLNNLVSVLQDTNRLAEAEPLCRRALAINEASYGPDHPAVAAGLNNLAELLRATDRLAEAEPLYRRALAISEQTLGREHPNVASILNNLALVLDKTNRLAEAESLYRRSLAINEASYGSDHPTVAIRLNNLAALLHVTNRLAEAEPLYRRCLEIDERSYGPDHPNVAIRLNNLALLLHTTRRLVEAERLYGRAVQILIEFQRRTGHEHPNRLTVLGNYRGCLTALRKTNEQIEQMLHDLTCPPEPDAS